MKSKFVKISVILAALTTAAIGISSSALSQKKTEGFPKPSLMRFEAEMPTYEKATPMVDRQGNRQLCFLESRVVGGGEKTKSIYACWSEK